MLSTQHAVLNFLANLLSVLPMLSAKASEVPNMPEKWNTAQAAAQCCGTQFTTVPLGKHPVCTICHHASHLNSVTSLPLPVAGCFEACRPLLLGAVLAALLDRGTCLYVPHSTASTCAFQKFGHKRHSRAGKVARVKATQVFQVNLEVLVASPHSSTCATRFA